MTVKVEATETVTPFSVTDSVTTRSPSTTGLTGGALSADMFRLNTRLQPLVRRGFGYTGMCFDTKLAVARAEVMNVIYSGTVMTVMFRTSIRRVSRARMGWPLTTNRLFVA